MGPRPVCLWYPTSKLLPHGPPTHLPTYSLGPKIHVLQHWGTAFASNKMNNSRKQLLFCLVFTQPCLLFPARIYRPCLECTSQTVLSALVLSLYPKTKVWLNLQREQSRWPGHSHTWLLGAVWYFCAQTVWDHRPQSKRGINIFQSRETKNNPNYRIPFPSVSDPSPRPQAASARGGSDQANIKPPNASALTDSVVSSQLCDLAESPNLPGPQQNQKSTKAPSSANVAWV